MISPGFTQFAAIDWSGAKGIRHKGIALAVAAAGDAAPELVRHGHVWSRVEVLDWLRELTDGPPTLVGMDFSFAPPFAKRGTYLPGEEAPVDAKAFWAFVDHHCGDADLGAASFLEARFRRHFYLGKADGTKADYMHFRACEDAFNAAGGGKPSTVFDAIGAAQVAKASFAGMRLLHQLNGVLPIWPFDRLRASASLCAQAELVEANSRTPGPVDAPRSVLVEIYCRAFIRMAGRRGLKLRTLGDLNAALAALGSRPFQSTAPLDDHQTDVLVAAAGLRRIADDPRYWSPAGLTPEIARTEGWTFGVP